MHRAFGSQENGPRRPPSIGDLLMLNYQEEAQEEQGSHRLHLANDEAVRLAYLRETWNSTES